MEQRGVIIGPSKAGKTVLLASLQRAVLTLPRAGMDYQVRPTSPAMSRVAGAYLETIRSGVVPIDGSLQVEEFGFELITLRKKLFSRVEDRQVYPFTMWDGPGGSLFRESQDVDESSIDYAEQDAGGRSLEEHRAAMLADLRQATGVILCADITDEERALAFFLDVPQVLNSLGVPELAVERLVICLTKVDQLVADQGGRAQASAETLDVVRYARDRLTDFGLRALGQYLRRETPVAFCGVSAFGFVVEDGSANFDREIKGLKTNRAKGDSTSVIDRNWRPFRVLEPFLYLATGEPGRMKVLRAREL